MLSLVLFLDFCKCYHFICKNNLLPSPPSICNLFLKAWLKSSHLQKSFKLRDEGLDHSTTTIFDSKATHIDNSVHVNKRHKKEKETIGARHWWLMPVILATQEAEIRRLVVRSQPGQIVCKTPSRKNPSQKRADGVAQGVGPKFKPQYCKKKKKKKEKKKR
jgi:hypothetical protein